MGSQPYPAASAHSALALLCLGLPCHWSLTGTWDLTWSWPRPPGKYTEATALKRFLLALVSSCPPSFPAACLSGGDQRQGPVRSWGRDKAERNPCWLPYSPPLSLALQVLSCRASTTSSAGCSLSLCTVLSPPSIIPTSNPSLYSATSVSLCNHPASQPPDCPPLPPMQQRIERRVSELGKTLQIALFNSSILQVQNRSQRTRSWGSSAQ